MKLFNCTVECDDANLLERLSMNGGAPMWLKAVMPGVMPAALNAVKDLRSQGLVPTILVIQNGQMFAKDANNVTSKSFPLVPLEEESPPA